MNVVLPEAEHYARLPRKVIGAGVVFVNEQNQVLVLETTYKAGWEIPGGWVDAGESMLDAAVRELKEEINVDVDRTTLKLTTIDYRHAEGDKLESILFHFWGGIIDPSLITVDNDEISGFKFVDPAELGQYCSPTLALRMQETVKAALAGKTVYLEDGYPA